ncbi:uncharacterized [Tachysurus ichikawai]
MISNAVPSESTDLCTGKIRSAWLPVPAAPISLLTWGAKNLSTQLRGFGPALQSIHCRVMPLLQRMPHSYKKAHTSCSGL